MHHDGPWDASIFRKALPAKSIVGTESGKNWQELSVSQTGYITR